MSCVFCHKVFEKCPILMPVGSTHAKCVPPPLWATPLRLSSWSQCHARWPHVLILLLDGNSPAGTGSASWSPQGSLASLPSMNVCLFLRWETQWRSSIWRSQGSRAKSDGSEDLAPRTWRTSPWVLTAGWMTVTTALAWARAHSERIDQADTHRRHQTVPGRSIY